jgi:hypothetical protein
MVAAIPATNGDDMLVPVINIYKRYYQQEGSDWGFDYFITGKVMKGVRSSS